MHCLKELCPAPQSFRTWIYSGANTKSTLISFYHPHTKKCAITDITTIAITSPFPRQSVRLQASSKTIPYTNGYARAVAHLAKLSSDTFFDKIQTKHNDKVGTTMAGEKFGMKT